MAPHFEKTIHCPTSGLSFCQRLWAQRKKNMKRKKQLLCLKHQPLLSESARKCERQTMTLVSSSPGVALTILQRWEICIDWEKEKKQKKTLCPLLEKEGVFNKEDLWPPEKAVKITPIHSRLCPLCGWQEQKSVQRFLSVSKSGYLAILDILFAGCAGWRPVMKRKHM